MPVSCVAYGCTNRDEPKVRAQGITFHKIPKDTVKKKRWLTAIRRKRWDPDTDKDCYRLCSEHFLPSDFKEGPVRHTLLPNAVPSVFKAFPQHLQPSSKKPRRVLQRSAIPVTTPNEESNNDSDQTPVMDTSEETNGDDDDSPEASKLVHASVQVDADDFRSQECPMTDEEVASMAIARKNVCKDHNYAYSSNIDDLKDQCSKLRVVLEQKIMAEKALKRRLNRAIQKKQKLGDVISQLQHQNMISSGAAEYMERFDGVTLPPLKDLLGGKKVTAPYTPQHREFALSLYYCSPKAYDFLRKTFTLPSPSTLRRLLSTLHCLPGFQEEAFQELSSHVGDINFRDAGLILDAMSIMELVEYDQSLGRPFGYIDFGGLEDFGDTDEKAKEALVILLVGYRKFWKLPLGYFLVKGTPGYLIAGMIRDCLLRTFDCGVRVWTITMDGAQCNISAFGHLGAVLHPQQLSQINTGITHPHPDANFEVSAIMDPPHMMKLVRSTLGEYKELVWPGHGTIKWEYITRMHDLQEEHGLRLGNKLTKKHINYQKNKMKVSLAVQVIASNSLAQALRWAHDNEVDGFEGAVPTAEFLELNDKLFDIINSQSTNGHRYKAALTAENICAVEKVFKEAESVYDSLTTTTGQKLIHSKRKTGPMGLLADIQSVRRIFYYMEEGNLVMRFFPCYKFSQDHLELLFNAIRSRNGWSYNPTARQFRSALRQILYHAGKNILGSIAANCIAQDDTSVLSLHGSVCPLSVRENDISDLQNDINNNITEQFVPMHSCKVKECKVCSAAISYIAGFYTYSLSKKLTCGVCKDALRHSASDKCPDRSLILMKNYYETDEKGLSYPSGSLCQLLYDAEEFFRRSQINSGSSTEKLTVRFFQGLGDAIFPSLQTRHSFETSYGTDNHYTSLIQLILKKYFALRLKKYLKDMCIDKKFGGNMIHRSRIFSNV